MSTKYTDDHEWITVDGDVVTVGITDYAQKALGDIVFVETPEVGDELSAGDEAGVVESVKAASEIYAPLSGEIVASNDDLEDEPSKVNTDPTTDGWMFKMKLSDPSELDGLLDADAYKALLEGLE
jgi:glycine cleavage system H protein